MKKKAVEIKSIGKKYRLNQHDSYLTVRDAISNILHNPFKLKNNVKNSFNADFWALKNISFNVEEGEIVGIIGKNGAGKSTLLKILSRITSPSEGKIRINGKVGALLEVGTGFHPELSGRENIFLSGSLLGMSKKEINAKFDDIVHFSEIEKFLDTPVKRYSSGMYVRLAFAVAAFLEPDILLVDEVLAVGDAAFQKKCLGKMGSVSNEGKTILFVSHNMSAISSLCNRCVLINSGTIEKEGNTEDIISLYQGTCNDIDFFNEYDLKKYDHYGNGKAIFSSLKIFSIDDSGKKNSYLKVGDNITFLVKIHTIERITDANIALVIYDSYDYRIIDANSATKNIFLSSSRQEDFQVEITLKNVLLKPGKYFVGLWMGRANIEDIDAIYHVGIMNVEIDPKSTHHHQIFPGVYQCYFDFLINNINL